jgi:hypothetical protein
VDVDEDGHPCLPTRFEPLTLKGKQKVVRKVFQKAYGELNFCLDDVVHLPLIFYSSHHNQSLGSSALVSDGQRS